MLSHINGINGSSHKADVDPATPSSGRSASREGKNSLSRDRRYPRLDNKNPNYKPAHVLPSKNFLVDISKPNYKEVKSSNYG